jgi:elongation factor Ts
MIKKIKKIREATGAGVVDVKKALEESKGDEEKAIEIIRQKGLEKADKKEGREVKEGVVGVYVHTNNKVAALIKVYCETDFVARNEEFQELARDLAMQVTAMHPKALKPKDIKEEEIAPQKKDWAEELKKEKKPQDILDKIMEGKESKLRNELALMSQSFVKDPEKTVEEHVKEKIAKIGENIQVGEFVVMEI